MTRLRAVALTGLPGSGKSAVGRALAERLGWPCVDLDEEVANAAGRTIPQIFDESGEASFRELELAALRRALAGDSPVVIACGGGLMAQPEARHALLEGAYAVWLDAPDETLCGRLDGGGERPLLRGDPAVTLPALRRERTPFYAQAHLRVDAGAPVTATAARIADAVAGTVRVGLPGGAYHVAVRAGALADVPLHLPNSAERFAVIADRRVRPAARRLVAAVRATGRRAVAIPVAGGERIKTWPAAGRLLRLVSAAGLQRHDCVVALGGGSVGDVAGFVAATYLRGIPWVNVPTTLLAMVDSGIGGKTGVNLPRGKNLAGAYWQPRAVVCDTDLLGSLNGRAYRSAFAEIVKYAMIADDGLAGFLDGSATTIVSRDPEAVAEVVRRCAAIKAAVVAADERETGRRAILNYGHTVGHALEAVTGYGEELNHGEAVAVGLRVAGRLSTRVLGCPAGDVEWQDEQLRRFGLGAAPHLDPTVVMRATRTDKKARGAAVGWVLLERRGVPRFGQAVPEDTAITVLSEVLA
jgi:shikimate kinase / 3-dehydroquinate synthase